jgi:hypothetical protein
MNALARIRWLSVLIAALLVEAALIAVVVPTRFLPNGYVIELIIVLPACFAASYFGGWWVARRAGGLFTVHGALVGAAAALIYGALTWKYTLPTIFVVANYFKPLAGAAGGAVAGRARHHDPIPELKEKPVA